MKKIEYITLLLLAISFLGIISCSKMDDYRDYTGGKEILYTGKVDSVLIHSGEERVVFTGLLISDPKISKVKIFWNTRADSIVMDINRSANVDTLNFPIPLPEGTYNFEVFTLDDEGNSSVVVNASGISYGDVYKQSLYNRLIKNVVKMGKDVIIDWYNGAETSPFVQVNYIDTDDNEHVVRIPTEEDHTVLANFKSMSQFTMQTYFLPDETAIDTFKTDYLSIGVNEDITNLYIKNPGNPFLRTDGTDKWSTPKDWQYTPNMLNQSGGTTGGWSWDGSPSGVIHFESKDWGGDGVENGKLYQTFELPAGQYSLEFYSDGGGTSSFVDANFVVDEGTVPPDINELDNVLAKYHWDQNSMGGNHTIEFSLTEPTTISFGFVISYGTYTWMHVNYVKLMSIADSY